MPGRHGFTPQIAGHAQKIRELHALIAGHARHGRFPARIGVRKVLDHAVPEAAFRINDVMREVQLIRHGARIHDVAPGTARARLRRLTVIVKLEGRADHLVALPFEQRGHYGAVHASRHSNEDTHGLQPAFGS